MRKRSVFIGMENERPRFVLQSRRFHHDALTHSLKITLLKSYSRRMYVQSVFAKQRRSFSDLLQKSSSSQILYSKVRHYRKSLRLLYHMLDYLYSYRSWIHIRELTVRTVTHGTVRHAASTIICSRNFNCIFSIWRRNLGWITLRCVLLDQVIWMRSLLSRKTL